MMSTTKIKLESNPYRNFGWMYALTLFLILGGASSAIGEPITLSGRILKQNSGGKPVAGAHIFAPGAAPTVSDDAGAFSLKFPEDHAMQRIPLTVIKEGMGVLGGRAPIAIPMEPGNEEPFLVVMYSTDEHFEKIEEYYQISKMVIQRAYAKKLNESVLIRDDAARAPGVQPPAEKMLTAMDLARDLSKWLAQVNLDQATAAYQQAMERFESGKIMEALEVVDRKANASERVDGYQGMGFDPAVEFPVLEARLHILRLDFEKAENSYRSAEKADPTRFDPVFERARLMMEKGQLSESLQIFKKALPLAGTLMEEVKTREAIGSIQRASNNPRKALDHFQAALEIYESLNRKEFVSIVPQMAGTLTKIAATYQSMNKNEAAYENYEKALNQYESLSRNKTEIYLPSIAVILNNMGILQQKQNRFDKAAESHQQALAIYRNLAETADQVYLPSVAATLNNLAILETNTGQFEEAGEKYREALGIYEDLAEQNPKKYEIDVASTLVNLGIYHTEALKMNPLQSHKKKGLAALAGATKILKRYPDKQESHRYIEMAARAKEELDSLSVEELKMLHRASELKAQADEIIGGKGGDRSKARSAFLEAIKLMETLAAKGNNPNYRLSVSHLYDGLNQVEEKNSVRILNQEKILGIRKALFMESPKNQRLKREYAQALGNMAYYLLFDGQYDRAAEKAEKGFEVDPSQKWIVTNLAPSYLLGGRYKKAKEVYSAYKDKSFDENASFRKVFLDDLEGLEKKGLTHPDMKKIRKLLNE